MGCNCGKKKVRRAAPAARRTLSPTGRSALQQQKTITSPRTGSYGAKKTTAARTQV